MKVSINNYVLGRTTLTTDRAESSHGIPVLEHDGRVYGPSDRIRPADDPLGFLDPDLQVAADIVRRFGLEAEYGYLEPRADFDLRQTLSKLFLGCG